MAQISQHNLSFSSAVATWANNAEKAVETAMRESVIEAVTQMQMIGPSTAYPGGGGGRNPVDTGWHTSHIEVSFTGMPQIDPESNPPKDLQGLGLHNFKWNRDATFAQIEGMKVGQTIYVGYTAAYAGHLEFRGGPSSLFVAMVAQRWPVIVEAKAAEVKQRMGL